MTKNDVIPRNWHSRKRIEIWEKLRKEGYSIGQIAMEYGMTRGQVAGALYRSAKKNDTLAR